MPDITICSSKSCSRRKRCWRHEVEPYEFRQSYADFSEGRLDGWSLCGLFITKKEKHEKVYQETD